MPRVLRARLPTDPAEERWLRKLARSKRAPAEQVERARTIVMSWDGSETAVIAAGLGCHPQTVRERIARFNTDGTRSVVAVSSGGRRPRLSESQRQELVAMVERVAGPPPPETAPATDAPLGSATPAAASAPRASRASRVSLDALVTSAHELGIEIGRSQLRRVLLAAGLRWNPTHSWGAGGAGHAPPREHATASPADQRDLIVGA